MKEVSDVICCVVDYGSFQSLAECLAEKMKQVYYYSPFEEEYRNLQKCCIGDGMDKVERLDEFLEPSVLKEIDLFVFPDIGYGGLQKHLRSLGKAVWGAFGVSDLELYRTQFNSFVKGLGLPIVKSEKVVGLSNLVEHLKRVEDKWVKINRYRENMETWHHRDFGHSERMLESLAVMFGGAKEHVVFVVQDTIDTPIEIGYDGWSIDGEFPIKSFQGYEKKNELYLGAWLPNEKLPREILFVNNKIAPELKKAGYRCNLATELRVKDKTPFFIDPTFRMAGQTQEHLQESCVNLAEVVWNGANGILVVPQFSHKVAAEATLHYQGHEVNEWKVVKVPKEVRRWCKLFHYCVLDELFHFPPYRNDEVGVVLGLGNTKEEAVVELKKHFKMLKGEPLTIAEDKFEDLFKEIQKAEAQGMKFC